MIEIIIGVLLGLIIGIINAKILAFTINKALSLEQEKKKKIKYMVLSYGVRYIALIAVFIIMIKLKYVKAFISSVFALTFTSVIYTIIMQNQKTKEESVGNDSSS